MHILKEKVGGVRDSMKAVGTKKKLLILSDSKFDYFLWNIKTLSMGFDLAFGILPERDFLRH